MSETALVTGPTAGIGHAFAQQLAARGHDLVLVARDAERLEKAAAELRAAHGVEVEVLRRRPGRPRPSWPGSRPGWPTAPGRSTCWSTTPASGSRSGFLDNPADAETAMLDVLVTAVLRLSHAALGPMAERGRGGIINVSSVAAFLPRGTYSAAKAWVNSFSEWAAHEYRPRGVTVMALCPGFTKTEFHERMDVGRDSAPDFMWLDADKLVATALSDFDKGRVYSIPSPQYKAIATAARLVPNGLLQRFQSLGRK